ncbi:MAG: hypothetical protein RBU37_19945 [Myxococcota bacterium]|jgi:hypothetical protein|nr:hypothetical protein [Myxococcota bacterium]
MRTSLLLIVSLITAMLSLCWVVPADAMPGFARKYRMSCQTCHAPFPRLQPYGDEFAGNGFRLPEGDPARLFAKTGDDELLLVKDFPIGMRIDLFATIDRMGESDVETQTPEPTTFDLKMPFNLKIISGGPISESISYYFYFFFSEKGEIAGIEDALLAISDVFGSGINLTVGQFAVSDPLLKGELRLTRDTYAMFAFKPPLSSANLKYDRGIVIDYGFDFGLDASLQVVNGNGIGGPSEPTKAFDRDNYKNLMLRLSQDLEVFRIGAFAYWGIERRAGLSSESVPSPAEADNQTLYVGGDFTFSIGPFELNALYTMRHDDNPDFVTQDKRDCSAHAVLVEANLIPGWEQGNWSLTALYNLILSDYHEQDDGSPLDYHSVALSTGYLIARNVRLMAEYVLLLEQSVEEVQYTNGHRGLLGLVAAF